MQRITGKSFNHLRRSLWRFLDELKSLETTRNDPIYNRFCLSISLYGLYLEAKLLNFPISGSLQSTLSELARSLNRAEESNSTARSMPISVLGGNLKNEVFTDLMTFQFFQWDQPSLKPSHQD